MPVFWTWWPWADLSQAAEYAHAAQHASWAGAPGPALMRPIGDAPDEETLRILTRAVRHFPSVWLADRLNDLTDGTLKQLSQDALPITRLACLSLRLRQRLADQVQFWDALCQHLLDNHLLDNHLLDNHLLDNHTSHTLTGMPVPDPLLGPRK